MTPAGGERVIGKWVKENLKHDFVFLTDWPISIRPFYPMRYADNPGLTQSFDLLGKGLEITTGAQREHRADVLTRQAVEKGLHLEPIQFYLDFFKAWLPAAWRIWFWPGAVYDGSVEHC